MEAKHGTRSDADTIPRDGAQHKRASRKARPVDDDALAGLPHTSEGRKIVAHQAAGARQDTKIRARRRGDEQDQCEDHKDEACHLMSPCARRWTHGALHWLKHTELGPAAHW